VITLISLFKDQEQENETIRWRSNYIDKVQITNWFDNLVKVFPNRGGQTQKGSNILLHLPFPSASTESLSLNKLRVAQWPCIRWPLKTKNNTMLKKLNWGQWVENKKTTQGWKIKHDVKQRKSNMVNSIFFFPEPQRLSDRPLWLWRDEDSPVVSPDLVLSFVRTPLCCSPIPHIVIFVW
jgi:hypothetical protein